jgi:serine/threonine-protein kinase
VDVALAGSRPRGIALIGPDPARPTLGPYRLIRRIAEGGMAEVWEAHPADRGGESVALKLLELEALTPSAAQQLLDEARIGASLHHRNLVRVLDLGLEGHRLYFAMELLRGRTLANAFGAGEPLPVGLVVAAGLQILAGLEHAHSTRVAGGGFVVHRDVKPSNLFVTDDGVLKVIDFGVAHIAAMGRTTTDAFVGTIRFASPEQVRREPLDPRSDLFSLGVVLYELLTGQPLFQKSSQAATLSAILWEPVLPLRHHRPDASVALEAVLQGALRRERDARPESAPAFAAQLAQAVPAEEIWSEQAIAAWLGSRSTAAGPDEPTTAAARIAPTTGSFTAPTEPAQPPPAARRRRSLALGGVLTAALLAFAGAAWRLSARGPAAAPPLTAPSVPAATNVEIDLQAEELQLSPSARPRPRAHPKDAPAPAAPPGSSAPAQALGTVTFRAYPWAAVYLDGRSLGETPLSPVAVPAGPHVVRFVGANDRVDERPIVVKPGESTLVKARFE